MNIDEKINDYTDGVATSGDDLQETRMQHSENLRQNIVHAAAALLQEHGPEAVTVRRVAERMECSTKIIYNLFGKKRDSLSVYILKAA